MKTFAIALLILFSSCKNNISKSDEDILFLKIDLIFKDYITNNAIDDTVLDLYETNTDIDCSKINLILKDVYKKDQEVRTISNDDPYIVDSINLVNVTSIYKFCKNSIENSQLDWQAYLGLYSSIHHSEDKDLMAFFYNDLNNFVKLKKIQKIHLAVFVDRFLFYEKKKQFFGTQTSDNFEIYTEEDFKKIDTYRKIFGLEKLDLI